MSSFDSKRNNTSNASESFPLIITNENNKRCDANDWSDQELDDLFQSPLEQVLDSMRFRSANQVSRRHCLRSVIYFSVISFVFGVSFSSIFITYIRFNNNINNKEISSQFSTFNSNNVYNRKQFNRFSHNNQNKDFTQTDSHIRDQLLKAITSEAIVKKLKLLTKKPQLAGTPVDEELAKFVYNEWKLSGINASFVNYTVLLSYPDVNNPNLVSKISKNGQILYNSSKFEVPLNATLEEIAYYEKNPPFLAYSAPTKTPLNGSIVYVNYGRAEDYDYLKQISISVNGSIAIARYGKIFRANMVKLAEDNGAIGLIIYSDPYDYTDGNFENTYPHSVYLPKSGVQRGTTQLSDGDPKTPFYPSIDSAYRLPIDKVVLPRIPAHCISYGDAKWILDGLKGPTAPKSWIGKLNITYNIGPGYEDDSYITLSVNTRYQESVIYNVIGIIEGCTEPDRYVLVGNHRDSWTFGSVDPSSGTAAMLELSKAFMSVMSSEKWCPRRSIVFCSWAAEEYGLIGSTEWVEENQKLLGSQAIAYLNVDIAVEGNYTLRARGVPLLYKTIWDAAKVVPNPDPQEIKLNRKTVYDTWIARSSDNISDLIVPKVESAGSGSDHSPFLQITGVPVVDISYTCDRKTAIKCYPLYHTMYETYNLQANLLDRGFSFNKALTQVWAEMVRSLSDSLLLPFSVEFYPIVLKSAVNELKTSQYKDIFANQSISLSHLENAVQNFENTVNEFVAEIKEIDDQNLLLIRRINDRLMFLERTFIEGQGLPFRKDYKHVVLAPSSMDSYSGSSFSGLYDLLWQFTHENNDKNKYQILEEIKKHLSVIVFHINAAKRLLRQTLY